MMQRRLPRPSRRRSVIISIFSPPVLVLFANDGVGTRYPRRHLHHMPLCERITCGCRTGRSAGPTAINGGVRIRNLLRFTASNSRHSTRVIHPASRHLRPKTIFVFSFFFFFIYFFGTARFSFLDLHQPTNFRTNGQKRHGVVFF